MVKIIQIVRSVIFKIILLFSHDNYPPSQAQDDFLQLSQEIAQDGTYKEMGLRIFD